MAKRRSHNHLVDYKKEHGQIQLHLEFAACHYLGAMFAIIIILAIGQICDIIIIILIIVVSAILILFLLNYTAKPNE